MKLTRGAWFLLGFGLTLGVIWAGASVWTLLEERDNGTHLTKIERIVVGLHKARKATDQGGDALQPANNAGQQPTPAKAPAHEHVPPQPHSHPKGHPHDAEGPAGSSPAPTGKPAGQERGPATTEPAVEDTPDSTEGKPLLEVPGVTLGKSPCPVEAVSVRLCTE